MESCTKSLKSSTNISGEAWKRMLPFKSRGLFLERSLKLWHPTNTQTSPSRLWDRERHQYFAQHNPMESYVQIKSSFFANCYIAWESIYMRYAAAIAITRRLHRSGATEVAATAPTEMSLDNTTKKGWSRIAHIFNKQRGVISGRSRRRRSRRSYDSAWTAAR